MVLTSPAIGSREDIQQRLLRWCLGTEQGLARIEYLADHSRQAVLAYLQAELAMQNIPFYEIKLPINTEAAQVLYFLRDQLEKCSPGVVSITGFSNAFMPQEQREGLSGLNFNREQWASFSLRQLWWFTPEFSHLSQEEMPDLNSWFILRLRLLEGSNKTWLPIQETPFINPSTVDAADMERRAKYLLTLFNQSEKKHADPLENLKFYGLPALKALLDSGDHQAALALNQRLEPQFEAVLVATDITLLTTWIKIYERLGKFTEAIDLYQQTLGHFDEILLSDPESIGIYNYKGVVSTDLGNLQKSLAQHNSALKNYQQAIIAYDKALELAPNYVNAHNNRGLALQNLGDLQADLAQAEAAQLSYQKAIMASDKTLKLVPNLAYAHNNQSSVFQSLGDLQARLTQTEDAQLSYQQAIAACDKALELAPDYVNAHNNRGNALSSLGDLQIELAQLENAQFSYQKAIMAYDQTLKLSPNLVEAHSNRGNVLRNLGNLQADLEQYSEAQITFIQAIESCDRALAIAPNYAQIFNTKGLALSSYSWLLDKLGKQEEAKAQHIKAIEVYTRSLDIVPNQPYPGTVN